MSNTSIKAMTPDEFRAWCKSVGIWFTFDEEFGTWHCSVTPDDLQDFCLDVLEEFSKQA